jgi:DNA-binding LacI/PurR family transcriptional regulator
MDSPHHRLSASEQAAAHLRALLRDRRITRQLPGVASLARQLNISPVTMRVALRQLETEGWLQNTGPGKPRLIQNPGLPDEESAKRQLRIVILPGERIEDEDGIFQQTLMQLRSRLESAGHICRFAPRTQSRLQHDPERIQRLVASTEADAWIVIGGKREILTWFASRPTPTLALGGVFDDLPIAGTAMEAITPFQHAVGRLTDLGHRRIVFLAPDFLREPSLSPYVAALSRQLAACGIAASSYHLPSFPETPEGVHGLLSANFQLTPPTAIIVTYTTWLIAALSFMASRGLLAGRDVSLVCLGRDHWMPWHQPPIAHFSGDDSLMVQFITRWVHSVARGQPDNRQKRFPLAFLEGGSISPPRACTPAQRTPHSPP